MSILLNVLFATAALASPLAMTERHIATRSDISIPGARSLESSDVAFEKRQANYLCVPVAGQGWTKASQYDFTLLRGNIQNLKDISDAAGLPLTYQTQPGGCVNVSTSGDAVLDICSSRTDVYDAPVDEILSLASQVVTYCDNGDQTTGGQVFSPDNWNLVARHS